MRVVFHTNSSKRRAAYAFGLGFTLMAIVALLARGDFGQYFDHERAISDPDLTVAPWNGKLELKWNPAAVPDSQSKTADILIRDGDHRTRVPLTSELLRNGNLVYTPATDDVSFRLVTSESQQPVECIRYVGSVGGPRELSDAGSEGKPSPFDATAPASDAGAADRAATPSAHPRAANLRVPDDTVPASARRSPLARVGHGIAKLWPFHHNSEDGGHH